LADELADIFAETLFIAHDIGISLDEAWNRMRDADKKKINERK
jgi:NTP pyrophosphatase (non-canonical NTP hydrolase)